MRAREGGRGESHSHPYHIDIQVGSCIHSSRIMYLLECVWLSLLVHLGEE